MKQQRRKAVHDRLRTPTVVQEKITQLEDKYQEYEFPKVSVVVPTFNAASTITLTLERILFQDYPDFEVLIIDAGSTDRTLEVVQGYRDDRIHVYSVAGYQPYEMMNKGISQATGQFINFIFPGDFYLYKDTHKSMMGLALQHDKPNLVFCGTLLRDGYSEVKTLFRKMSPRILREGQQPASLQSCWFRIDTFQEIGKFDTSYALRGAFEFLCRYSAYGNLRSVSVKRILIDYDLRSVTRQMVLCHFTETYKAIRKYFGFWSTLRWVFRQKDWLRFLRLWFRSVRVAFLGR